MPYPALTRSFLEAMDREPSHRALLYKQGEQWLSMTSTELLRAAAGLSHALAGLGVKPGDRVGLFSPNRPEWHIADFAILGLGAASVPLYFNESPDRITYILNDSGARVVIAAGEEQCRRLLGCGKRLPNVAHIILAGAPPDIGHASPRLENILFDTTDGHIADYRRRAAAVAPEQVATLIYTSGTTGEPKGVILTHSNLSSNDIDSTRESVFLPGDVGLSFLPLSHVYERLIAYSYLFHNITLAYVEKPDWVQTALREVRPTLMAAVPRVFEKIYAGVMEKGGQAIGYKKRLFDWGMRATLAAVPWRAYGKAVPLGVKLRWAIANAVLYPKIRAALGGRLRSCCSGAAPLALGLLEFFTTVGVKIYQGYGLTETSPVVSTNTSLHSKVGTVGRPIANVEVRIAADGEILVKGPCVMQGYFNKPDATRTALTEDGWLHTGDIGHVDSEGYLSVTDRKKDLIKTAAGKFVAPQPIENKLKTCPLILNACVVGDRRKYVIALIVPNFANVEAKTATAGLHFASRAEMLAHPWVCEMIQQEVNKLNDGQAQYETVKRFALLDHDFSFEGGQLTYTMKLKRRVIEERYHDVIESLYEEAAPVDSR